MVGIIDVGGGMRAAYGSGVLDWCLDEGIDFSFCVGISAGSANLASYLARQRGRNMRFYTEYAFRKEYMSFQNLLRSGSYVDLGYVYGTLSNEGGEDPLDFAEFFRARDAGRELITVATDATTGRAHYFTMADYHENDLRPMAASSNLPVVDREVVLDGVPYYDGGLSDPIPLRYCFENGCDRVVVILTRPRAFRRSSKTDVASARLLEKRFSKTAEALSGRADIYNRELDWACECEKSGRVLILAPNSIGSMSTLTKDKDEIRAMYDKGFADAKAIAAFLAHGEDAEK